MLNLVVDRDFKIALGVRGKYFPSVNLDDKLFCWEILLLGGGNLTRSDFDLSKYCYLVGGINTLEFFLMWEG